MKNVFLLSFILMGSCLFSQVGINTNNPKSTLQVIPTSTDGTTAEGIIAPNLTRAQLVTKDDNYTSDLIGAIVYITTLDGTTTIKTSNVTKIGYYYFDGSSWQNFNNDASQGIWYKVGTNSSSETNTDNSYLTAKAIIGGNSIADINGATANAQLTVTGGDASINNITVGRGAGNISTKTTIGNSSLIANTTGSNNTSIGANSGISITTGSNNIVIGSNSDVVSGTGSNQLNIGNSLFGKTGNSSTDLGSISIGKTIPDNGVALDVNGTTQITGNKSFRYVDGNQGDNKVLFSDADGNASWEKVNALNAPMYPSATTSSGYTGVLKKGINSGISITLPPYSVWVVELGQIVRFSRYLKIYTATSGSLTVESVWIRLIWSDAPTGSVSNDVLSGKLISGACYVGGEFHLIAGTSVIQNSSDQSKTYYLTTDDANEYFIDPSSPLQVQGLFGNWGENSLVVIPANNQSLDPNQ